MSTDDVAAVQDRAAIAQAIDQYFYCLDRAALEQLGTAFWPDATVQYDEGRDGTFEGLDRIAAHMRSRRTQRAHTSHMKGSFSITLRGDEADADTFATAFLVSVADAPRAKVLVRGLRYRDVLQRRGGEWRIRSRVHQSLWQIEADASVLAQAEPGSGEA
jgi:hypothetical protein